MQNIPIDSINQLVLLKKNMAKISNPEKPEKEIHFKVNATVKVCFPSQFCTSSCGDHPILVK